MKGHIDIRVSLRHRYLTAYRRVSKATRASIFVLDSRP